MYQMNISKLSTRFTTLTWTLLYRELLCMVCLIGVAYSVAFALNYVLANALSITSVLVPTAIVCLIGWVSARFVGYSGTSAFIVVVIVFFLGMGDILGNRIPDMRVAGYQAGIPREVTNILASDNWNERVFGIWLLILNAAVVIVTGWQHGYRGLVLLWLYVRLISLPVGIVLSNAIIVGEGVLLTNEWLHRFVDYIHWQNLVELFIIMVVGLSAYFVRVCIEKKRQQV